MDIRSIGLWSACLLVLSVQIAAATVSCRAVDWIADLRLIVSSTEPREKHRSHVERLVSGTDTDAILDAFDQTLDPPYSGAIERLIDSARRVAAGGGPVFSLSDARRVDVAIQRLSCAEDRSALAADAFDTASGENARGSQSSRDHSEERPLLLVIGTLALLPISLVIAASMALGRSVRRSRRYECHLPVSLGPGQHQGFTVDISRTGCQIETPKFYEVDDWVEIYVGGLKAGGTVRWQNGKRVGIDFDEPMRKPHLQYLLQKSSGETSESRKKGAVSRPRPSG